MLLLEEQKASCLAFWNKIHRLPQNHTTFRVKSDWLRKVPASNVILEKG
jgi:hypothetical protein